MTASASSSPPAEVATITDNTTGSVAEVLVSQGFNCFSWRPALAEGPQEMLWAPEEFERGDGRPSSAGIPLLFPFPGRIGAAAYTFEGKAYQLNDGDKLGNALHGFAFNRPWRLTVQEDASVEAEFRGSVDAPETLEQWPSDYQICARYEVSGAALNCRLTYQNCGEALLPCGLGTHAYFRLPLSSGSETAASVITVPVRHEWTLKNMLPTGELIALDDSTPLAKGLTLGDRSFDTPYTGIATEPGKPVTTSIIDPRTGRELTQTCDESFEHYVIYTPPHREAICIEPYTCVPDPFTLEAQGITTGLQVLAPGESRTTEFVLQVKG